MYRWTERSGVNNCVVSNARADHARTLESLREAGLQDAIDCLASDNCDEQGLWFTEHPRFQEIFKQAEDTIKGAISGMRAFVRDCLDNRDGNCEVTEDATIEHLEHVLVTQPGLRQPKKYCETRVAALQQLLVMQQGAVNSPAAPPVQHLNKRGSRVHNFISTLGAHALWQARSR
jgi:hypothetical protein